MEWWRDAFVLTRAGGAMLLLIGGGLAVGARLDGPPRRVAHVAGVLAGVFAGLVVAVASDAWPGWWQLGALLIAAVLAVAMVRLVDQNFTAEGRQWWLAQLFVTAVVTLVAAFALGPVAAIVAIAAMAIASAGQAQTVPVARSYALVGGCYLLGGLLMTLYG